MVLYVYVSISFAEADIPHRDKISRLMARDWRRKNLGEVVI